MFKTQNPRARRHKGSPFYMRSALGYRLWRAVHTPAGFVAAVAAAALTLILLIVVIVLLVSGGSTKKKPRLFEAGGFPPSLLFPPPPSPGEKPLVRAGGQPPRRPMTPLSPAARARHPE